MSAYSGFGGSAYSQPARTVASVPRSEYAQSTEYSGSRSKDDDHRVCGGILETPSQWKWRTRLTIIEIIIAFICAMLMAALEFHWGIDKSALFGSPLLALGWTATVLLLWNLIIVMFQERYDFFTRSEKNLTKYRPRKRLLVWEITHFVFVAGIASGWTHLLLKSECHDTEKPGCAIGITADALLWGLVIIEIIFLGLVSFNIHAARSKKKGMHEAGKSTMEEDLKATESNRRAQDEMNRTVQNSSKPKKRDKNDARGGSGHPQSAWPDPSTHPQPSVAVQGGQVPRGPPPHPGMRPY